MAWATPKTDWETGNLVAATDLNNIGGDLEWLYARRMDILHYQDQKASGVAATIITFGGWRTRELNTEVVDTGNFGSFYATNVIQLASGIYLAYFVAPIGGNYAHRARLRNVSDNITLFEGSSGANGAPSVGFGRFVLAAQKNIELQHWIITTNMAGGSAVATGENEVYADLLLVRIGD